MLSLKNGKYFVEENEVPIQQLAEKLLEYQLKSRSEMENEESSTTLIVQADKREKYKYLNEIVIAANQTGYNDIKFVVLSCPPRWLKQ